jgi:Laminin G domain
MTKKLPKPYANTYGLYTNFKLPKVEGNVFMVYNMGTNDHPIGEVGVKVNDNQYHVVRFTRSGANSTLQIDDYSVQTLNPGGMILRSHKC